MNYVIVVTGASSGFGLMSARALAHTGHTVYAGMRETAGRNAPRVASFAICMPPARQATSIVGKSRSVLRSSAAGIAAWHAVGVT